MRFLQLAAICGALVLTVPSCTSNREVDRKHDRIIVIHDEVMPMMPELRKLEKALLDTLAKDTALESSWHAAALELKQAQDMMWAWMNQYRKPEHAGKENMDYLAEQERAIIKVSSQMHEARKTALKILTQ